MSTKTTEPKIDVRPRFGWCEDLNDDPQTIGEQKRFMEDQAVAVIPLPFMSDKIKKQIRDFTKSLWP